MRNFLLILLFCLFGTHAVQAQTYQEVVYLKNGSIIRGGIIEEQPNILLKIKTADGNLFVFKIDEIEKITKEEIVNKRKKETSDINSGYKAFLEVGTIINFRASGFVIARGAASLTTSHGYQFNPWLFVGAGLAVDYHAAGNRLFVPLFADFRANFLDRKVSPFFSTKIGYAVGSKESYVINPGLYVNPTFGVRFILSPTFAMNLALGYNMQQQCESIYGLHFYEAKLYRHALSLRLGFEF